MLTLRLRTPSGLCIDQPVHSIRAEDLDGWFGIEPGRSDLVAVLPAGLLVYRDAEGEAFVALSGGLLQLEDGECRVMARDALVTRNLEDIIERVETLIESRQERRAAREDMVERLVREAQRRLVSEVE